MTHQINWVISIAVCCVLILGSGSLYAEATPVKTKRLMSPSLAESVDKIVQIMSYVDTRLLSEENVKRIEASENYEAIAILHRSLNDRELVGEQINQGRFEEAYAAMKTIGNKMAVSIKLSWSHERASKRERDLIDNEQAISDAYLKRAKQTGIHSGDAGEQALMLYKHAQEKRMGAQALIADRDYKSAMAAFKVSTKLLQKALVHARKNG